VGFVVAVLVGFLGTGLVDDATVGGLLETVPGGFGGWTFEGRTAEPDGPFWAVSRDFSADAAFF
jgi:hypothetical protein